MKIHIARLVLIVSCLFLPACNGISAAPAATSTPTLTPTITMTPTSTSTPTPLPTATFTATPTPFPTELAGKLESVFKILVLTQANTTGLNEFAKNVRDGQFENKGTFGNIIILGAMMKIIDEALVEPAPIPEMEPIWIELQPLHRTAREIFLKWWDQKGTAEEVITVTDEILPQIETILEKADRVMENSYGYPKGRLAKARAEGITGIIDTFAKPLPTGTPKP